MTGKGMPSLVALLGLLAVAGYQNRDRIGEMMRARRAGAADGSQDVADGAPRGGGFLGEIADLFGAGRGGGTVSEGLTSLVERFRTGGRGEAADSWVAHGPNRPIGPEDVESVVGSSTVEDLARRTGLSRDELLRRLASVLPDAVDRLTPAGRIPSADEAARLL
ncbi:MAG: YidB family protein [Pseudomonadota bacterium]|jgi:uncharacterized protein YidB (DUF937 family)